MSDPEWTQAEADHQEVKAAMMAAGENAMRMLCKSGEPFSEKAAEALMNQMMDEALETFSKVQVQNWFSVCRRDELQQIADSALKWATDEGFMAEDDEVVEKAINDRVRASLSPTEQKLWDEVIAEEGGSDE